MKPMNWYEAKALINKMNEQEFAGHNDWRLPSLNELTSLIDYESQESIVNQITAQGYKGVQAKYYWSSSSYAGYTDYAWYVSMFDGYVSSSYKTKDGYYVWPVRGELEFLEDLTSLNPIQGRGETMRVFSDNDLRQLSRFMDERDVADVSCLLNDYAVMNSTLLKICKDVGELKADCTIYKNEASKLNIVHRAVNS